MKLQSIRLFYIRGLDDFSGGGPRYVWRTDVSPTLKETETPANHWPVEGDNNSLSFLRVFGALLS